MLYIVQARIYEDNYHKEHQQRERSRNQHESLTKGMIAQIDNLGQNGGRFGSPDRIPELQEENRKLRQEVSQYNRLLMYCLSRLVSCYQ